MSTTSAIVDQVTAAVRERSASIEQLRERIAELVEPLPVGTVLSDDRGEIGRVIRACAGGSQWSNRSWDVVLKGRAVVATSGRLICDLIARSYWDGSNRHDRSTGAYRYANGEVGDALRPETGQATREFAARLPAALAAYVRKCEAEAAANAAAASAVAAGAH